MIDDDLNDDRPVTRIQQNAASQKQLGSQILAVLFKIAAMQKVFSCK